jgi:uncharacterized surface protein with fasciclin (FAS1) repeats
MNVKTVGAVVLGATLVLAGCTDDGDTVEDPGVNVEATPGELETPVDEDAVDADAANLSVAEVVAGNDQFTTLTAALEQAGLLDTLSTVSEESGTGPYILFAPTNEAFDALPEGVLDALLLPENEDQLTAVLTYHVVPEELVSVDITPGDVATLQGMDVTVLTDGEITVNGANVVLPDLAATNGVVHAIDAVLVPSTVNVEELTS